MDNVKEQSPHPALQAMLPRLASLNPGKADFKPVFQDRAEARQLIEVLSASEGGTYHLNPVWAINHADLRASEIAGWSYTEKVS